MVRISVAEFNVFLRILEDEVERHKMWLETEDFVSEEEFRSLEEEFMILSSMFKDMKLKKERLLSLLR